MLEHFCHDEFIILWYLLITFSLLFCRSKLWRRAKCFAISNSLVGSSQLRFGFWLEYLYCMCMCWMRAKDFLLFPSSSTYSFSSLSLYVKYLLCKSLFIYLFLFCLLIFFFLQSDISGEVIKILREDGGEFGIFGCLFIVGFFCKFHFICSHLVCFALQILLDMAMLWLQSFHHFLE